MIEMRSPLRTFPHGINVARRSPRNAAAFTLTELLVVIAVIVLMAALGVAAFKGGASSDGTQGASHAVATLFDAARNEAIMRRVPVRVIFDVGNTPDTSYRRAMVAYSTNGGANWIPSGPWVKFPANAYFDYGSGNQYPSRPSDDSMSPSSVAFGASAPSAIVAYEYFPNGQVNDANGSPLKVIFSPGTVSGGTFTERPDRKSLYGFVINKLGHTQQFADLNSLTICQ